jgi:Tol biopolymer transport system component
VATLYRVPVLGGAPTVVVVDVDSAVSFSPDGQRFTFTRGIPNKGTTAVVVAQADGTGVRELATVPDPARFQSERPAWSPDGKTLLAIASIRPGANAVFAIDAATGRVSQVPGEWSALGDVEWMRDAHSFLANGADVGLIGTALQMWRVSYPDGARTHVTNDLNSYRGISLSADGLSLATVETQTTAGLEVSTMPQFADWRRLTGEPGRADGTEGLKWLADHRIVYTSAASGPSQLWIVNADGSNAHQLTTLSSPVLNPFPSADGRWVYFDSVTTAGRYIYRIQADGSGLEQITHDGNESRPVVSPDGSTVFFSRREGGENRPARVPAQGGTSVVISKSVFSPSDISSDGTQLVGPTWSQEHRRSVPALLPVAGGDLRLLPDIPVSDAMFTKDGHALVFPDLSTRPIRLMTRPLPDGVPTHVGVPMPMVTFNGALSRDGHLVISHGTQQSDVVLITALRSPKP